MSCEDSVALCGERQSIRLSVLTPTTAALEIQPESDIAWGRFAIAIREGALSWQIAQCSPGLLSEDLPETKNAQESHVGSTSVKSQGPDR